MEGELGLELKMPTWAPWLNVQQPLDQSNLIRLRYSQAFSASIDEGLEQWLVMWDGLQDVTITGDVANGPLS